MLLPASLLRGRRRARISEPDFWGPFFMVLAYALIIMWGQAQVVPWIMMIWLAGSFIVFFLARVLGSEASYASILSITGYSVLPLALASGALLILRPTHWLEFCLKVCCPLCLPCTGAHRRSGRLGPCCGRARGRAPCWSPRSCRTSECWCCILCCC